MVKGRCDYHVTEKKTETERLCDLMYIKFLEQFHVHNVPKMSDY